MLAMPRPAQQHQRGSCGQRPSRAWNADGEARAGAQLAVVVSPATRSVQTQGSVRGRTRAGGEQDAALTMGRSNSGFSAQQSSSSDLGHRGFIAIQETIQGRSSIRRPENRHQRVCKGQYPISVYPPLAATWRAAMSRAMTAHSCYLRTKRGPQWFCSASRTAGQSPPLSPEMSGRVAKWPSSRGWPADGGPAAAVAPKKLGMLVPIQSAADRSETSPRQTPVTTANARSCLCDSNLQSASAASCVCIHVNMPAGGLCNTKPGQHHAAIRNHDIWEESRRRTAAGLAAPGRNRAWEAPSRLDCGPVACSITHIIHPRPATEPLIVIKPSRPGCHEGHLSGQSLIELRRCGIKIPVFSK